MSAKLYAPKYLLQHFKQEADQTVDILHCTSNRRLVHHQVVRSPVETSFQADS